jgi:hypothetical protein
MYEKVENKVIFGDFESDWFDQEFGLKQGCVLSPTLFSPDLCNGLIIPLHQSSGIISKSEIHVKRSDNDFIIISPPYFRNSFGISSIPGALPILRLFKAFVIDSFVKTIENILKHDHMIVN